MRNILITLTLAASTSIVAAGQSKGNEPTPFSKAEQQLLELEHKWIDAFAKPDRTLLERLMTDDYVSNNADGSVTNKAQSIAAAEAGFFSGTSSTSDDVKVRIYGNVAVITCLDTVVGKFNGQFRHTSIWVKRNGNWRVVSWQGTAVPPSASAPTAGTITDGGELAESYAVDNGEVKMSKQELITMIENAGFEAVERDTVYNRLERATI